MKKFTDDQIADCKAMLNAEVGLKDVCKKYRGANANPEIVLYAYDRARWDTRGAEFTATEPSLLADKAFILDALTQSRQRRLGAEILAFVPKSYLLDEAFMLAAVQSNWDSLTYASKDLRADKDFMLFAVSKHSYGLSMASDQLRNDKDVVLAAVKRNGNSLGYAPDTLHDDKDVVLAAVSENGAALRFASDALRQDQEVVEAAIAKRTTDVKYASPQFLADPEAMIGAAAVKRGAMRNSRVTSEDWKNILGQVNAGAGQRAPSDKAWTQIVTELENQGKSNNRG